SVRSRLPPERCIGIAFSRTCAINSVTLSQARRMHVFIDESGNFTGYHPQSVSVVGALAIPEGNLPRLRKKYARIRQSLLTDGDEVKGRDLDAVQINRVVRLIKDRDAIFEVTAVDLELH